MNSRMYVSELFKPNELFKHQLTNHSNNQYHSHEFIEIFYVILGSAQQKLNNKTIPIAPGDLFLLRPSDKHCFSSDNTDFSHRDFLIDPKKFTEICRFFDQSFCEKILTQKNPIHIHLSQHTLNTFEDAFNLSNTILSEEKKASLHSFILSNILLSVYTTEFSTSYQNNYLWVNDLIGQLNSPYNFLTPIHSILEQFSYSQPYICKVFKKHTGKTPVQYFNDVRLSQAYLLIKSSADSISNIAEKTGFFNRSFFYKIFKEKYGITPSEAKKGVQPLISN